MLCLTHALPFSSMDRSIWQPSTELCQWHNDWIRIEPVKAIVDAIPKAGQSMGNCGKPWKCRLHSGSPSRETRDCIALLYFSFFPFVPPFFFVSEDKWRFSGIQYLWFFQEFIERKSAAGMLIEGNCWRLGHPYSKINQTTRYQMPTYLLNCSK